jgi:hypothetical protein
MRSQDTSTRTVLAWIVAFTLSLPVSVQAQNGVDGFLKEAEAAIKSGRLKISRLKKLPANFRNLSLNIASAKVKSPGISGTVSILGHNTQFYLLARENRNKQLQLHAFFGLEGLELKKAFAKDKSLHEIRKVKLGYTVLVLSSTKAKLSFASQPAALKRLFQGKFKKIPKSLPLPADIRIFSHLLPNSSPQVKALLRHLGYAQHKSIAAVGTVEHPALGAWLTGTHHPFKSIEFRLDAYLPRSPKLGKKFRLKNSALSLIIDEKDGGLIALTGEGHMGVNRKKLPGNLQVTLEPNEKKKQELRLRFQFDDKAFNKALGGSRGKLHEPAVEAVID